MKLNDIKHKDSPKSGFTIPKGYFDGLEEELMAKVVTEELPHETGFNIPTAYFNSVEQQIIEKVTDKPKTKVIDFKELLLKRVIPIAAAASLLLFFVFNFNKKTVYINNVASTDIENWIDQGLIDVDAYEIAEVYNDINLNNNTFITSDDDLFNNLNGDEIETYLLENQ